MYRLLLALMILVASPAWANTIALHTNISADNAITGVNSNFSTISNWANGNIEGSTDGGTTVNNIKADSVYEINMADDANPRLRDSELFNITTDTQSGATLTQGTVVESGCIVADDTDLTSDISACIVYVNGYRVSKSATSITYTATRDCYVDLSQSGVYTSTCVTNGAAAPAVAANSSRLAKVVTDGTEITTITSLFTTRVPGLIVPANYRNGLAVSFDTTTTMLVMPGSVEINNSMVNKTGQTTLTISTAGDWAGGSSLRALNTYGYVGIDASGNLKMHTTAPTHDNYAVSSTDGKFRYATWSSTVYRVLGWFFMNGATSGQLQEGFVSNIKDGDVENKAWVVSGDGSNFTTASTSLTNFQTVRMYTSGAPLQITQSVSANGDAANRGVHFSTSIDSGTPAFPESQFVAVSAGAGTALNEFTAASKNVVKRLPRGTHTLTTKWRVTSGTDVYGRDATLTVEEK